MKKLILFLVCPFIYGLILLSCNPVKQVLKDNEKIDKVWEKALLQGRCLNDSVTTNTTDTLYTSDTLYGIDYLTDTAYINGEIVITKHVNTNKIIRQFKTVTINSHTVVKDKKLENKQKEIIEDLTNDLRLTKQQRNKWSFRFFALLGIIVIVLFRKPILAFLTGGFSKITSLLK
jgi:hypothetical protein